jgi:UDP-N-acetyl-D-glucosamine dehydrogenase
MGGHCLPVDPFYLAFKAREHDFYPEFIELAGKVNRAQPTYCVDLIARALNDVGKAAHGAAVLILGVSYKTGVGDTRESPALQIIRLLRELGAEVSYHDPHVAELPEFQLASVEMPSALESVDAAAIVTAHPELDYEAIVAGAPLVVDFRGVTRGIRAKNLVRL